jgi:hypothetical protein
MASSNTSSRFSNPASYLAGCRLSSLIWQESKVNLLESEGSICISFLTAENSRKIPLKNINGKLQCNLQELELLRCVAKERESSGTALSLLEYGLEYSPQRRYPCLFPHKAAEAHDIWEIVPGMGTEELRELGHRAIKESNMVLCSAPATTCKHSSVARVDEEVQELATYWPVRQTHNAEAVEGIIDIVPILTCWDSRSYDQCMFLEPGEGNVATLPIKLRMSQPVQSLADYIGYIKRAGRNNPDLAIHHSWRDSILHNVQPGVLDCRFRPATTHPTRLYDAFEKIKRTNIKPEYYLAISYCWDQWPEAEPEVLEAKLDELSRRLKIRYFWVDRLCVDQDDQDDKAREIPLMREYYMGASACVVLTGPDMQPFECIPQHHGALLSAYQQIQTNSAGLKSLFSCKWASRVWTLQEALLSRQIIYAVADQLIDGDYISELVAYIDTFSDEYDDSNPEGPEWIGGYGCYGWNARNASVVTPRQFRVQHGDSQLTAIMTVFGGEQQFKELNATGSGLRMPLEQALIMTADRHATKKEDHIYGILGISETEGDIDIEYSIEWDAMLDKLGRAGAITERLLASPSLNSSPKMSWLPDCGSRYGPFQNLNRLSAFVQRPKLSWSEIRAMVMGLQFKWEQPEIDDWAVLNIHGMGCRVVRAHISFPDMPGLVARVAGTSETEWSTKRLSGSHILLCEGVDKSTRDTVAIKVSGDIETRKVCRKDGYIMEIHEWVHGDPGLIVGKEWTLGSNVLTVRDGNVI